MAANGPKTLRDTGMVSNARKLQRSILKVHNVEPAHHVEMSYCPTMNSVMFECAILKMNNFVFQRVSNMLYLRYANHVTLNERL